MALPPSAETAAALPMAMALAAVAPAAGLTAASVPTAMEFSVNTPTRPASALISAFHAFSSSAVGLLTRVGITKLLPTRALEPKAIELCPSLLALLSASYFSLEAEPPMAIERSPTEVAEWPMATERSPTEAAATPITCDALPFATAWRPMTTALICSLVADEPMTTPPPCDQAFAPIATPKPRFAVPLVSTRDTRALSPIATPDDVEYAFLPITVEAVESDDFVLSELLNRVVPSSFSLRGVNGFL
ncbi:hypothetical protein EGK75_12760 [Neisseria weixii]|uniref:Secreted protein n=1 Tax=Neisseria weixii TaxID=1853276 RepID=A0A3N4MIA1_9NEIS|nr:hypothetical protein EGK74_12700 [Neisseria weixii]RPD83756.1 hypothetical protein EGK75_12760 [Neisseria weixii]